MENLNNTYVDLLDEDKPIAGQKYVCLSFISPENILKQKELFYQEHFLKHLDFKQGLQKFNGFLNFLSYKYNLDFNKVSEDFKEFVESERDILKDTNIEDEYKTYLDHQQDGLDKEFNEKHNFQTSVRGLKVRGAFETVQEAELRCKLLREQDPNHNIYVGQVGVWMPWEPEAYKTGRVEYLEKELNDLMQSKQENEEKAKQHFDERVKETKKQAIEENKKIATESGNKLTQNIDEEGNLIGIQGTNTTVDNLAENEVITGADIKKELFEGDNIITKK
jgi:hypothetical protein